MRDATSKSLKNIKGEQWKDIPGYTGLYQASTAGRIRTMPRFKKNHSKKEFVPMKIKSQRKGNHGYYRVNLWDHGKTRTYTVHKLIALTFLKPSPKKQINHIDGNRLNNKVENLEWVTDRENQIHRSRVLHSNAGQYPKRPVVRLHKETMAEEQQFESLAAARDWIKDNTEFEKAHESKIGRAIDRKWAAYGFKWKELTQVTI